MKKISLHFFITVAIFQAAAYINLADKAVQANNYKPQFYHCWVSDSQNQLKLLTHDQLAR